MTSDRNSVTSLFPDELSKAASAPLLRDSNLVVSPLIQTDQVMSAQRDLLSSTSTINSLAGVSGIDFLRLDGILLVKMNVFFVFFLHIPNQSNTEGSSERLEQKAAQLEAEVESKTQAH